MLYRAAFCISGIKILKGFRFSIIVIVSVPLLGALLNLRIVTQSLLVFSYSSQIASAAQ